jgi:predicted nucleotidyltransferase
MAKILPNHTERLALVEHAVERAKVAVEDTTHNRTAAWGDKGIVHTFVGGSDLHGASVGSDDLDIYGVFVEKPEFGLGIRGGDSSPSWETFQWSTAPDTRKNTKDDVDVCVHSLRKWARLAASGNPTIMHFLFTPKTNAASVWDDVVAAREMFVAKGHVKAFLGYARQQNDRLNGRAATNTNRPELVEKYGYDTKMAMHMIRLMLECEEFMKTGWITLPNPHKDELIQIRLGKYSLVQVNHIYAELEQACSDWMAESTLPESVDRIKISKLLEQCYRTHWESHEWVGSLK